MSGKKIADLILRDSNPRTISSEQFSKLKKSIKEFPKMLELRPIVYDPESMEVLGGNMRLRALIELGHKTIKKEWLKSAADLTEDERKRFIIVDNIGFGTWNYDIIANEWGTEELEEWGMELPIIRWSPDEKYEGVELGDGIVDMVGYGLQSFWIAIDDNECDQHKYMIDLPKQENKNRSIVRQKYSRTHTWEIERIIRTYMRKGDYFLENCCGWSTFGCSAKHFGYSGIGIDIWDKAISFSLEQIKKMPGRGNVEIKKMNGLKTEFKDNSFDFIYCNPPFVDQEKYGGSVDDIGTGDLDVFSKNILCLMSENYRIIKKDGICIMTINDNRKRGEIIPLHMMLIKQSGIVGFKLHDFVIAEIWSQKIRLRKQDYNLRRTVKCHEYVIAFKK